MASGSLRWVPCSAKAYGVPFSSLFGSEAEDLAVVRASEGVAQRGNGLSYTRLSEDGWSFNLQPLRLVVPADREGDAVYRHEGEQWMHVLSGRLRFGIGDREAMDGRDAEAIVVACAVPYLLLRSYLQTRPSARSLVHRSSQERNTGAQLS